MAQQFLELPSSPCTGRRSRARLIQYPIQNLTKSGNASYIPQTLSCRINNFWITYTKGFKTDQFYSDLSLFDQSGNEVKRKIIFVNEPIVFDDVTLYQTDWDIVGLKFKLDNNKVFQIPLKKRAKGGNRFLFGSLALDGLLDEKLTVVANDLNGKVLLYDSKGVLVKESSIGGFITTDKGTQIQISDL